MYKDLQLVQYLVSMLTLFCAFFFFNDSLMIVTNTMRRFHVPCVTLIICTLLFFLSSFRSSFSTYACVAKDFKTVVILPYIYLSFWPVFNLLG